MEPLEMIQNARYTLQRLFSTKIASIGCGGESSRKKNRITL
jgi:hypothetical protein